jgi:hypothetical protein
MKQALGRQTMPQNDPGMAYTFISAQFAVHQNEDSLDRKDGEGGASSRDASRGIRAAG